MEIEYLLKQLNIIFQKYEMLNENKEHFNIFRVLHKEHDERRLHSRFISNLLNPTSSHKKGIVFLQEFIETLYPKKEKRFEIDLSRVEVYPTEEDKKENHDIDILIINRVTKQAIIIENKIYAGDSNNEYSGQLERYFNHVIENECIPTENIRVFYLTLDRHEPSDASLGEYKTLEKINALCISYDSEVLQWLTSCLKHTITSPFLRESILQYKKLIEQMTSNDNEVQQRIDIRDKIGASQQNMESAKMLFENFKHVKWHTVRDFWDELRVALLAKGYVIEQEPSNNNITDLTHFEDYRKGQVGKQDCGIYFIVNNITFYIWKESGEPYLYWGCESKRELSEKIKANVTDFVDKNHEYQKNSKHHFWAYVRNKQNEKINITDFTSNVTFNLVNAEYRKETVEVIVEEIADRINEIMKTN